MFIKSDVEAVAVLLGLAVQTEAVKTEGAAFRSSSF